MEANARFFIDLPFADMIVEHFPFFPVIVLIGIILVILSAKFIFRLAILFVAILLIWYGLYFIGLAPNPINYFKEVTPPPQETHVMKDFDALLVV